MRALIALLVSACAALPIGVHAASLEDLAKVASVMTDEQTPGLRLMPGHGEHFSRTQLVFHDGRWHYHLNFWRPEKTAATGSDPPFLSIWRRQASASPEQVEHFIDYDLTGVPGICLIPAGAESTAANEARCAEAYDRAVQAVLAHVAKAKERKR